MNAPIKESLDASRAREKKERETLFAQLAQAAGQVALNLGREWSLKPLANKLEDQQPHMRDVVNRDGRCISLSVPYYPGYNFDGKVHISGRFNYGPSELGISFPYNEKHPSIAVTLARGGAAIAKEIQRRLMPDYDRLTAMIAKTVRSHQAYRDAQQGISARLAAISKPAQHRFSHSGFSTYSSSSPYVDVRVSNGAVDVKITNLPESLAATILQLIADVQKPD